MNCGYINVAEHPLALELEKNYIGIREEFDNLRKTHGLFKKANNLMGDYQKESSGKILYTGNISSIFIHVAPDSCSKIEYELAYGKTEEEKQKNILKYQKRQQDCPILFSICKPYYDKDQLGSVGFNIITAPSILNMHFGMTQRYVRFHLGLYCDSSSLFHIKGSESRSWQEGKVWAFNDGLAFHGTTHESYNERIILIVDLTSDAVVEI